MLFKCLLTYMASMIVTGAVKILQNGVSVVIFTGTCYAKQMCFVTC